MQHYHDNYRQQSDQGVRPLPAQYFVPQRPNEAVATHSTSSGIVSMPPFTPAWQSRSITPPSTTQNVYQQQLIQQQRQIGFGAPPLTTQRLKNVYSQHGGVLVSSHSNWTPSNWTPNQQVVYRTYNPRGSGSPSQASSSYIDAQPPVTSIISSVLPGEFPVLRQSTTVPAILSAPQHQQQPQMISSGSTVIQDNGEIVPIAPGRRMSAIQRLENRMRFNRHVERVRMELDMLNDPEEPLLKVHVRAPSVELRPAIRSRCGGRGSDMDIAEIIPLVHTDNNDEGYDDDSDVESEKSAKSSRSVRFSESSTVAHYNPKSAPSPCVRASSPKCRPPSFPDLGRAEMDTVSPNALTQLQTHSHEIFDGYVPLSQAPPGLVDLVTSSFASIPLPQLVQGDIAQLGTTTHGYPLPLGGHFEQDTVEQQFAEIPNVDPLQPTPQVCRPPTYQSSRLSSGGRRPTPTSAKSPHDSPSEMELSLPLPERMGNMSGEQSRVVRTGGRHLSLRPASPAPPQYIRMACSADAMLEAEAAVSILPDTSDDRTTRQIGTNATTSPMGATAAEAAALEQTEDRCRPIRQSADERHWKTAETECSCESPVVEMSGTSEFTGSSADGRGSAAGEASERSSSAPGDQNVVAAHIGACQEEDIGQVLRPSADASVGGDNVEFPSAAMEGEEAAAQSSLASRRRFDSFGSPTSTSIARDALSLADIHGPGLELSLRKFSSFSFSRKDLAGALASREREKQLVQKNEDSNAAATAAAKEQPHPPPLRLLRHKKLDSDVVIIEDTTRVKSHPPPSGRNAAGENPRIVLLSKPTSASRSRGDVETSSAGLVRDSPEPAASTAVGSPRPLPPLVGHDNKSQSSNHRRSKSKRLGKRAASAAAVPTPCPDNKKSATAAAATSQPLLPPQVNELRSRYHASGSLSRGTSPVPLSSPRVDNNPAPRATARSDSAGEGVLLEGGKKHEASKHPAQRAHTSALDDVRPTHQQVGEGASTGHQSAKRKGKSETKRLKDAEILNPDGSKYFVPVAGPPVAGGVASGLHSAPPLPQLTKQRSKEKERKSKTKDKGYHRKRSSDVGGAESAGRQRRKKKGADVEPQRAKAVTVDDSLVVAAPAVPEIGVAPWHDHSRYFVKNDSADSLLTPRTYVSSAAGGAGEKTRRVHTADRAQLAAYATPHLKYDSHDGELAAAAARSHRSAQSYELPHKVIQHVSYVSHHFVTPSPVASDSSSSALTWQRTTNEVSSAPPQISPLAAPQIDSQPHFLATERTHSQCRQRNSGDVTHSIAPERHRDEAAYQLAATPDHRARSPYFFPSSPITDGLERRSPNTKGATAQYVWLAPGPLSATGADRQNSPQGSSSPRSKARGNV